MDRAADSLIGSTATENAIHGRIDIGVGRIGFLRKQRRRHHDLSGLAVSALRDMHLDPGDLQGVASVGRKTLDRKDFSACCF
jgi:hypothetical protein